MTFPFLTWPAGHRVLLRNGRTPVCLIDGADGLVADDDGVARVEILIEDGRITDVRPGSASSAPAPEAATVDLDGGQIWPTYVDVHTHLDKGYIWPRAANPDGSFMGALETVQNDRTRHWRAEDVRARFDFSVRCAYAHGTSAVRTHIDSMPDQAPISWPVFEEMRAEWAGRVELQAACLAGIEHFREPEMAGVADQVQRSGGIFGAVAYPVPDFRPLMEWVFDLAMERGLGLDLHVDETLDPASNTLAEIAEIAIEKRFPMPIQAGHCCSLSTQSDAVVDRTLDLVAEAGIAIVSLPMCNMYLQDREGGRTPRLRGVTILHELKRRGIPVSVASDNTRDPFYAYGDMDMHEVFTQAARIAHLDHPMADWPSAATRTPADVMGLADYGRIAVGGSADLVLFRARHFSELLSRPQADRAVVRDGRAIDTTLPDYRELDVHLEGEAR